MLIAGVTHMAMLAIGFATGISLPLHTSLLVETTTTDDNDEVLAMQPDPPVIDMLTK